MKKELVLLIFFNTALSQSDQTLADFQTRVSPRDNASITELPPFISTVGSSNYFLHIDSTKATDIESGGMNISGFTDDYDNQIRQGNGGYVGTGTAPDIGADESDGTPGIRLDLTMFVEGFYSPAANSQVCDTINVFMRNALPPYAIVDQAKRYVSTTGIAYMKFSNTPTGIYFTVITHRNSIETWSALPVLMTTGVTSYYDFTNSDSQAFGNNMKQVDASPVEYAIYSGDENQDGSVDVSDLVAVYNDALNFNSGYLSTDMNGDDFADAADLVITYNNSINFVSVITP